MRNEQIIAVRLAIFFVEIKFLDNTFFSKVLNFSRFYYVICW